MENIADNSVEYIYVKFITLRNGRRLYVHERGLKAFRIAVRNKNMKA